MDPVVASMIVLAVIALGELVSIWTGAKAPALLITIVVLFVLLQIGVVPKNIIDASTFAVVGTVLQPALLVHMGTLIPVSVIKKQYKAVLIAVCGMVVAVLLITAVVTPIFGYASSVAGAGPLNGGLIAFIITSKSLKAAGLGSLVAIPLMVLVLQGLVGMPLTSNLLRRHAKTFRNSVDNRQKAGIAVGGEGAPAGSGGGAAAIDPDAVVAADKPARFKLIPDKYLQSSMVLLFIIFVGGAIAVGLGNLTGISYSLWGLAIGIVGAYFGIYPPRALEKANGFTIAMVGLIFIVLASSTDVSVKQIVSLLPVVATIVIVGTIGLVIGGYIGSKIFRWDPFKGIPVALTALFGFPVDYLISHEVSRSVGRTDEEREAILGEVLAPMIIGGFTTVTAGSVVIASLLVKTL
ncbi:hypothetical protein [Spelaeicoccus albus]|uniref:Putative effector of murein hydrolase LrgA (UPF0299 family) n=1 Tax=Spelaeicoccus albus TaxID=1280376 RepID=A0A7Z0AAS8_9MICO|nr:hypothetical protein [Spelaeicoccus albus]NYI66768.1 putative effector of murein hydrolase LrgA (UPF0299 family) [Spelaeicoccus albus]